ncbi:MAG: diacylglycerol kinase family lipid kinase [Lachnospiraceae bacterium]|nr:diacylglycerol kinase family lipid kinase [Lachnospiraceae bacterium]
MFYFIVNPHSRSGKALNIWNELEQTLKNNNIEYTSFFTDYIGHAIKIAEDITCRASSDNHIKLVILGGDGTVNEAYNGIRNHKYVTIGYIPTGSGNDFARGLKLPTKPPAALKNILNSTKTIQLESGIMSTGDISRRFAVSCGIGYDASITHRVMTSKLKKVLNKIGLGKLVYAFFGVINVFKKPQTSAEIYIDGELALQQKKFYFASIHILKYEGGGFPFAPHANPSDSLLAVTVFHSTTRLGFALNLIASMFTKHVGRKGVTTFQCKACTVKTSKGNYMHTDGEGWGLVSELTTSICSDDEFINIII